MNADNLNRMAMFLEYFAFMLRRWAKELEERKRK